MGPRSKSWATISVGLMCVMVCGVTALTPPRAQAQILTLPPLPSPFILTDTPAPPATERPTQAASPTPANTNTTPATLAPTETSSPTPPATATATPTLTLTATKTPSAQPTMAETKTATLTSTLTKTATPSKTNAAMVTFTRTRTPTQTPTEAPIIYIAPPPLPWWPPILAQLFAKPQAAPLSIIINEVAWGGTAASTNDEWIELYNPGALPVSLIGWTLTSNDGTPTLTLTGTVPAGGYFLLERTDDTTVSDIVADQIYVGALANGGETLTLRDELSNIIDTANGNGGAWPAGSGGPTFLSMERMDATPDADANWLSNNGLLRNGLDANGLPLNGTPKQTNSSTVPTATPTSTSTLPPPIPYQIIINEVAWAGTAASSSDEWLELHNPTTANVDLSNWLLSDGGDVAIILPVGFVIEPGGYRLLERTSDTTVSDIPADVIYTGGLSNTGETLTLYDAVGNVIDTANAAGGAWPAGDDAAYASMERVGIAPESWRTHSGAQNGVDANGNFIRGTPRNLNSAYLPTPTPFPYSTAILLNEFLPAPSVGGSEFIELINVGGAAVDISGWLIDDAEGGSAPQTLPSGTVLQPGEIRAFNFSGLNNTGDSVRLLWPDGRVADSYIYDEADENISFARVPDGGGWTECGAPTPGAPNAPGACGGGGSSNRAPVVPIGTFRQYPAGAWATLTGRVTLPAPFFGKRIIYIQDETGGIALYLGRGDWPQLQVGQRVTVLGYSRIRSTGRLELYVRNMFLVGVSEPDGITVAPRSISNADETVAGQLVNMVGRVVRLESTAFWIDAGEGAVRVFFSSTTGVRRPRVRRGEIWSVIGIITEQTATRTRAAGWQIQPRFLADVQPLTGPLVPETTATLEPTPTEEPTATPGP